MHLLLTICMSYSTEPVHNPKQLHLEDPHKTFILTYGRVGVTPKSSKWRLLLVTIPLAIVLGVITTISAIIIGQHGVYMEDKNERSN